MVHSSHSWSRTDKLPKIRAQPGEAQITGSLPDPLRGHAHAEHQDRSPGGLTVVDGFAGGNIYIDETGQEIPGSPSGGRIMNAIREAEFLANEKRTKRFRIKDDYFFIEKEKEAFCSLELTLKLSEHAGRLGNSIHLINDDFASHSARIVEFVTNKSRSGRNHPRPHAATDKVPFACIREIMRSIPNAEIILTFAADFLIDYLREERPNRRLNQHPGARPG